jgi:hypothetical protein
LSSTTIHTELAAKGLSSTPKRANLGHPNKPPKLKKKRQRTITCPTSNQEAGGVAREGGDGSETIEKTQEPTAKHPTNGLKHPTILEKTTTATTPEIAGVVAASLAEAKATTLALPRGNKCD